VAEVYGFRENAGGFMRGVEAHGVLSVDEVGAELEALVARV